MPSPSRACARVLETRGELLRLAWLDSTPARVFDGLRGPAGQHSSVVHRGLDELFALADSPAHGLEPGAELFPDQGPPVVLAREQLAAVAADLASALLPTREAAPRLLDTGVKVIDVLAPLTDGGRTWLLGVHDVGRMKFLEELHLRLADTGGRQLLVFPIIPSYAATIPAHLDAHRFPPDVDGGLRTVWLVSEAAGQPASAELEELGGSRFVFTAELAERGCYPAVDAAATRVDAQATALAGAEQRELIERIRAADRTQRATLSRYLAQPFESAREFSGLAGTQVARAEACASCRDILAGREPRGGHDLPTPRAD